MISVLTKVGNLINIDKKAMEKAALFSDLAELCKNKKPIRMKFCSETIVNYMKWSSKAEHLLDMRWEEVIDIFRLADFVGCDTLKVVLIR